MSVGERNAYTIKVVENALDILEAFSEEGGDLGVAQLSSRLGMNKGRVFKLLATFEQRGYVEKESQSGRYRAGLTAYETGRKLLGQVELRSAVGPAMAYLAEACNEVVYLAVADRDEFMLLDMVESSQRVQVSSLVGKRYPFVRSWLGRAVLPLRPEPHALTEGAARHVADEVYVDRGVLGEGVFSLTVPITKGNGQMMGGICLVAPEFRVSTERVIKQLMPHARAVSMILAKKLCFNV